MSFEQLKITFFEESNELLVQLEQGLNEMQDGSGSEDTVHAIFRAVHSIKGGAGVFGFGELIEFAHVFETVMDAIRNDKLAPTPDVVDVLFRSNDTLADLVAMAREGKEVEAGFGGECRTALERLIGMESEDKGGSPSEMEGIEFVPVQFDSFDDMGSPPKRYSLSFKPKASFLTSGLDPLFFFNTLRAMGQLDLVADTATLPDLSQMQAGEAYLGWTGTLETSSPQADIDAVLMPLADDCEIEIVDLSPSDAFAPAVDDMSALPPDVAALLAETESMPMPVMPDVSAPPIAPVAAATPFAPAISEPKESGKPAGKPGAATTIRVELEKIDRVVNMVGELVIAQAMLGQVIEDLPEETSSRVANILSDLVRHTRGLKDSVMAIRAQPVSSVFQRMPRLVRELSAKTGKKVELETFGETTEVDKTIIERLSDPLTHIIRNSIDHGIESPADRLARGKPEHGTVRLSADQRGGRIVIEIADDGGGINTERVLKKARDKGLVDPNANLTDDEICNLIFMPGFSTAETVSDISGRGVGMDVVRRNIQDLGGRTSIKSEAGRGMVIQLALPLTLAVMDGMVVEVDHQTYVLPIPNIVECLRPGKEEIHQLLGTSGTLQLRGDIVPLVHLGDLLGVTVSGRDRAAGIVIITEASDGTRLGLIADELCGHQQVVIKSIEENCGAVRGIAGATILGDGHVAFILDVEALSEMTTEPRYPGTPQPRNMGLAA